jgi:23S rRNA pseudouridine1911/1915/1917 synthase
MLKPDIIYQDDHVVVVQKPSDLLTIPHRFESQQPSVSRYLTDKFGKIFIVHRLDKETSGLVVFAKNEDAHRHLSIQFEKKEAQKIYLALLDGLLHDDEGRIDKSIGEHPSIAGKMMISREGKPSLTLFKTIERFKHFSLVEADIKTGRTHQIRIHFQSIGYPMAVDSVYGRRAALFISDIKARSKQGKFTEEPTPLMARTSLHAHKLTFTHPLSNEVVSFESELPKDFRATLAQLRKWGA